MSHGQHRAPKKKTTRFRRIAAGISLATAAATTGILTTDLTATPQADTTWGAPDTDTTTPVTPVDTGTVTPLDTTWG